LILGLKGRKAFVTGASRGIGAAIAEALAAEGVSLALFGRDTAACSELAERLAKRHPGIAIVACHLDLEKPATLDGAIAKAASTLGGCDILINCAGGAYRGRLEDVPEGAWESSFQVKPFGLIRMTKACLPLLRKSNQGRIINIAGTHGREPSAFSLVSSPINLATLGVTKALANELGPQGITVNAINPGPTDTGRWKELVKMTTEERHISTEEAEKLLNRDAPLGRVGTPQDIAGLAVFLSSMQASMISGVSINVDGGRSRSI
jgi:NAD(P)-dependent dehydrogenase (short-subunit alcohol dehydrogenase family)